MSSLLIAISSLAAAAPMLLFLSAVWWLDRYDREPMWLLGVAFTWGASGAIAIGLVLGGASTWLLGRFSAELASLLGPVLIAPLVEEPAKALAVAAVLWSRHFDNMTDGFVYGAAVGLGFGMTENYLYFERVASTGSVGSLAVTIVIRTLFSAVMHAMASAVFGSALGAARFRGLGWLIAAGSLGLLGAMGVHALWNGLLTAEGALAVGGRLFLADLLLLPIELLAILVVFELCVWEESRTIRRELQEEAEEGHLPAAHIPRLASFLRRIGTGWLPRGVPHHRYVHAATQLAMRKKQARLARGAARPFYREEVQRWRQEVRSLLRGAA